MKFNCLHCAREDIEEVSVDLTIPHAIVVGGVFYCRNCKKVSVSLQDAIKVLEASMNEITSKCKYCYHFMNASPMSRGCWTERRSLVVPGIDGLMEQAPPHMHANDMACKDFKLDYPDENCGQCRQGVTAPHHPGPIYDNMCLQAKDLRGRLSVDISL